MKEKSDKTVSEILQLNCWNHHRPFKSGHTICEICQFCPHCGGHHQLIAEIIIANQIQIKDIELSK